ncbi:MAG: hypothetical protein HC897_05270 [Thermoanaerobaculia bacterium]|nr:hypothetical protein [Thermoanaerobaculia bacterium]
MSEASLTADKGLELPIGSGASTLASAGSRSSRSAAPPASCAATSPRNGI